MCRRNRNLDEKKCREEKLKNCLIAKENAFATGIHFKRRVLECDCCGFTRWVILLQSSGPSDLQNPTRARGYDMLMSMSP